MDDKTPHNTAGNTGRGEQRPTKAEPNAGKFKPYRVWRGRRFGHKAEPTVGALLLASALDKRGLTDLARLARITTLWPEAVGERIANAATPDGFSKGVLKLRAKSSAWQQELSYLKETLVRLLNEKLAVYAGDAQQGRPAAQLVVDLRIRAGLPAAKKIAAQAIGPGQEARIKAIAAELPAGDLRQAFIQLMRKSCK